ncbi:18546_t:CDS:2, partial [Acaulospora morrowiae]
LLNASNVSRKFSTSGSSLSISNLRRSCPGQLFISSPGLCQDKFLYCHRIKNKSIFTNSIRFYTVPSTFNTEKTPIVQAQEVSSSADTTNTLEVVPINEILEPATSNVTAETVMKLGDLKAMGLVHYTPVGGVETFFEAIHVLSGIPWWGTILFGTLIVRLLLVPISIDAVRTNVKLMNIQPKAKKLMDEIKDAKKYSDTAVMLQKAEQMKNLYKSHDTSPYRGLVLTLIQAPIMISFFLATKKMAEFPVESFKTGGMLWFTDLTIPDPYYILPALTTAGFLSIVEMGSGVNKVKDGQMQTLRWFIRGITVLSFPITMNLPSSVLVYFTGSCFFSILQTMALNNKGIREYLKIPKQIHVPESKSSSEPSENNPFLNFLSKSKSSQQEELPLTQSLKSIIHSSIIIRDNNRIFVRGNSNNVNGGNAVSEENLVDQGKNKDEDTVDNLDIDKDEGVKIEQRSSAATSWTKTLRNLFQTTEDIDVIWKEYRSIVENGNLEGMDRRLINRLLSSIKKFDKDHSSCLEKIQMVHNDMNEAKMEIGQTVRNYLIEAYLNNRNLDKARMVFEEIKDLEGPLGRIPVCPYRTACNMMMKAYGYRHPKLTKDGMPRNDLQEVTFIYSLMHEKQIFPDVETKNILAGIFEFHYHRNSIQWFTELMDKRLVDSNLVKEIVLFLIKKKNLNDAIRIYEKMRSLEMIPGPYIYNSLIDQLGKQERIDEALRLAQEMESLNVPLDTVSYNVLIKTYGLTENHEKIKELFDELLSKKETKPSLRTFSEAINAYAKLGRVNSALWALDKMRTLEMRPDQFIYTSLIELFSNANDTQSMERVFRNMLADGVNPLKITYGMLTVGYCRENDIYKAFQICRIMISSGIEPDVYIYNALISLFAERKDPNSASILFNEMRAYNIVPDTHTYTNLIHAYAKAEDIRKAEEIFMDMELAGVKPQTITYNVLLNAYVEKLDMTRAQKLYNEMLESFVRPDVYTFCCLIDGFCEIGKLETAAALFKHMQNNHQLEPDAHIYTVLIHRHLQHGDFKNARTLYENMIKRRIKPTYVTYAVLIHGHAQYGDLEFAKKIVSELVFQSKLSEEKSDIPPTVFTPLMDSYAKLGKINETRTIFDTMSTLGVSRNAHAYVILMDAYRRIRNYEAVWQLWQGLRKDSQLTTSHLTLIEWVESHIVRSDPILPQNVKPNSGITTQNDFSESLLHSFDSPLSSLLKSQLPPCHAVSVMIDALTAIGRYDVVQEEWNKLAQEGFEFDSHNWNHYAQSLILSGKVKDACSIIDKYLMEGWNQQVEIWKHFDQEYSTESLREKKRLLNLVEKFPHQKTLLMLADSFEKMKNQDWFNMPDVTKTPTSILLLNEIEEEYPEVSYAAKETAKSWKIQRRRSNYENLDQGYEYKHVN